MGFGRQLKIVLDELKLSIADLSRTAGIPASTIYSIIDRDTNTVGIDKVKKIEKAVCAVPGSKIYNLLYGINPGEEEVSTRQQDFLPLDENTRKWLLDTTYDVLTTKGQVKLLEYAEDLSKISEYRKDQE